MNPSIGRVCKSIALSLKQGYADIYTAANYTSSLVAENMTRSPPTDFQQATPGEAYCNWFDAFHTAPNPIVKDWYSNCTANECRHEGVLEFLLKVVCGEESPSGQNSQKCLWVTSWM